MILQSFGPMPLRQGARIRLTSHKGRSFCTMVPFIELGKAI